MDEDPFSLQGTCTYYLLYIKYSLNCTWCLAWYCEQRGDSQRGPSRHRVHVHPEGDPGDDDDEDGGQVRLDQVEAQRAAQVELGQQTTVVT